MTHELLPPTIPARFTRQGQSVLEKVTLNSAAAAEDTKALEHRGDRQAHGVIRVLHHDPIGPPPEADRQTESEFSPARLVQQVAPHATTQDVQFSREEGALDA